MKTTDKMEHDNMMMEWKSGTVVAAAGGIESALTTTLQPIRDLAKNWDIDIATCLEEYLVDLEFSQETREQIMDHTAGATMNFNFAQAAIVLQNSSGIYSRKVDYLHSYAYKMQEDLVSRGENQNGTTKAGSRKNNAGIDTEIEHFLNFDPHQEFLLLNDVIPTCDLSEHDDKINLPMAGDDLVNTTTHLSMSARRRSSLLDSVSRRRSIGSMALFPDQSIMTDGSGSLVNLASRNALLGTLDTTGTLRLQTGVCDIGDDGILRIPGSSSQNWRVEDVGNDSMRADDTIFDNGIDDDSNDDGGFVMADNDESNPMEVVTNHEKSKRVTFSDSSIPLVPIKPKEKRNEDPWALLDGDANNIRKPRPLRIGKTIVLPETVDKLPSDCVTGARTRHNARVKHARVPRLILLQASSNDSSNPLFSSCPSLGCKRALTKTAPSSRSGLEYGNEFAYIAKALAKRQADKRRELRNSINRDKQQSGRPDVPAVFQEYQDDDFAGDMGGQFYDDDDDDDFGVVAVGRNDVVAESAPGENNTGITSISDVYKTRDNEYDAGVNEDTRTFEELCRAHIAAFARGAEKYAAETRLSARVGLWQGKLMPLLDEEDRRPVFDIHLYGNAVIEKMESQIEKMGQTGERTLKPSKVVAFRDIARDCQPFDVCRMFLATLSLNNSGNVQFTDDSTLDALQVELVTSDIEVPMESYLSAIAA